MKEPLEKFIANQMDREQTSIEIFMRACDQIVRDKPEAEIPEKEHELRVDLINQEVCELFDAMASHNIREIADALADIIVVVKGTACTYGIILKPIFDEVMKTNMAKVGPDGKVIKNELGKVMKPKGWKPPNFDSILEHQGFKFDKADR